LYLSLFRTDNFFPSCGDSVSAPKVYTTIKFQINKYFINFEDHGVTKYQQDGFDSNSKQCIVRFFVRK